MKNSLLNQLVQIIFPLAVVGTQAAFSTEPSQREILPSEVTPTHYKIWLKPDSKTLRFHARVDIELTVKKQTSSIVLNATDLVFKKVYLSKVGTPTVKFDKKKQRAEFHFSKPIEAGDYTLQIDYTGAINKNAFGLFALDYGGGKTMKRALFTQFENSYARYVLPCWDEPGIKATFDLSVTIPEQLLPVGNTPIESEKPEKAGYKTVQFSRTPKMSTYLLFFSMGDFERVARTVNNVEIGVVVKRGDTAKAEFALAAAAKILPFYEEYFGVKYPLPKLDMIAAPGSSQTFSAMENWGAILYFDRVILVDPAISTELDQRRVYLVVAHEMAHQWFGNLVTMAWWEDLWLNEGFANWTEKMAIDHFHPEWKIWIDAQGETGEAMGEDAKFGTHPIVQPILNVLQADQAFDNITYKKGSAVIRMFEDYVGAENFRAGVRAYMKKYAYSNTVTDDLWHEIDSASNQKLTQIAHDFTLQAGIPLIDVKLDKAGWLLEQSHFAIDNSTPANRGWHVPIEALLLGSQKTTKGIVAREAPLVIKDEGKAGILLNPKQSAYYRTRYSDEAFGVLVKDFKKLRPDSQLGLINDARALGFAAYAPLSRSLALLDQISAQLDSLVLRALVNNIEDINYFYTDLPGQPTFQAYARDKLRVVFDMLGWTAGPNDDPNAPLLRNNTLFTLAQLNDKAIIDEAFRLFDEFRKNRQSLSAEVRRTVLAIVASKADTTRWQQLYQLALEAPSVVEQQEYYGLLTMSENTALAKQALLVALEKKTPETFRANIVAGVARYHPLMAFDFAIAHHKTLVEKLETGARTQYIPRLVGDSYDRGMIDKLESYARTYIPTTAMQSVEKAKAAIKYQADIREKRIPDIDVWLRAKR